MLTPQPEHARLASLMATSWNYPGEKPGDDVIQAIRRHDDGWKQAEETLPVTPAGAPANFDELELGMTGDIWVRSASILETEGRYYSAILVAEHFLWMAEHLIDMAKISARAAVALGSLIARERAVVQRSRLAMENHQSSVFPDQERFRRDLRLLQVCDTLSILLCSDFIGEQVITDVPYLNGVDQITVSRKSESLSLTLSPLPFKKNLRDHVNAYLVPKKVYDSPDELQAVLKSTKASHNEVHLGAG